MRSYNRVFSPRIGWLVGNACVCVKAAIDRLSIMHGGKPVQIGFHPVGQCVVSRVHAGEQGIAAVRRTLLDVEDASHRRLEIARHVGVPALTIRPRAVLVGINFH
jgi:hypothetical protein